MLSYYLQQEISATTSKPPFQKEQNTSKDHERNVDFVF